MHYKLVNTIIDGLKHENVIINMAIRYHSLSNLIVSN